MDPEVKIALQAAKAINASRDGGGDDGGGGGFGKWIKWLIGGIVGILVGFFAFLFIAFVLLFGPKSQASCSGVDATAVGTKLDQAELAALQANTPFYQAAAEKTKVPWQVFAAIHYRESTFRRDNPGNGQGIFQFYNHEGGPYPPGPVSDEEFARQLEFLGTQLQKDYVNRNLPSNRHQFTTGENDQNFVKDTFFSYNGRNPAYAAIAANLGFDPVTQPFEGSAYVMNNFDEKHKDMLKVGTDNGPVDTVDRQLGAFVIYTLGGAGGSGNCGSSGNDIVDIARAELAKNVQESPDGCNCGGEIELYTQGNHEPWCADFVSWVYKTAGRPITGNNDSWRIPGVQTLQATLEANAIFVKRGDTAAGPPHPGDIIIFHRTNNPDSTDGYHTGIVDRVDGDTVFTIEGNHGNAVAPGNYKYASDSYIVGWGRLK